MIVASVVTYNTQYGYLQQLLDCLLPSKIDKIYIVDNSEIDLISDKLLEYDKIEYIYGHGNIGYGAAHNIAIRKSISQDAMYHVVINPDIYFASSVISALASFMDENQNVGQVMPKVIFPNGDLQYLCKLLPTPFDLIGRRFFRSFSFAKKRNDYFELKSSGYDKIMSVPYLSGCFMFLRVSSIKNIGLFDENIFMYGEDIDYSRRMHLKFETIYFPNVEIVHAHMQESYKSFKMLLVHIKSIIYYFNKWGWFFDKERKFLNKKVLKQF